MKLLTRCVRWLSTLLSKLLIGCVRIYQIMISPFLGQHCRYHPSCSSYFIQAVNKYGPCRGAAKGIWRICRCHPWSTGGEDFP
ncbi:MAG: membrane protein insertion efficiency factor YidD [Planctomycetota bacterium]|nr:membrane protein insertion efficiency factor YidD [Planctomycetota bacterium]